MLKCIYLDESGELGFNQSSSKHFVITLMSCNEDGEIEMSRIMKKARTKLIKKKLKQAPELKGNNSTDIVREFILRKASLAKIDVYTIILNKSNVFEYLQEKKNKLYNYIAQLILNECYLQGETCKIILDRRGGGKHIIQDFNNYIKWNFSNKNKNKEINIEHKDSKNSGALQVLDFICWSIFRKYEHKDSKFYDIVKNKIVTERPLFPGP